LKSRGNLQLVSIQGSQNQLEIACKSPKAGKAAFAELSERAVIYTAKNWYNELTAKPACHMIISTSNLTQT
jgi:hypothetical protein